MTYPVHYVPTRAVFAYSRFGKVYVSTGMRSKLSHDQLCGVVHHEFGHIEREHVIDKLGVDAAAFVAVALLARFTDLDVWGFIFAMLLVVGCWFFVRRNVNHWGEFDADQYAVRAGYGNELAYALALVTRGDRATFDHPSVSDRIARIYEKIER